MSKNELFDIKHHINLEKLKKNIESLEKQQMVDILKIFISNNIKFDENDNGIFINLNNLDEKIIHELWDYLQFVNNQKKHFEVHEKEKLNLQNIFFNNINNNDNININIDEKNIISKNIINKHNKDNILNNNEEECLN